MPNRTIGDVLGAQVVNLLYQGPATTLWIRPLVIQNGVAVYAAPAQSVQVPATAVANTISVQKSFSLSPAVALNAIIPGGADGRIDVSVSQSMESPWTFSFPGVYNLASAVAQDMAPRSLAESSSLSGGGAVGQFAWQRAPGWPAGSPEFMDVSAVNGNFASASDFTSINTATQVAAQVNGSQVTVSNFGLAAGHQYWWRVTTLVGGVWWISPVRSFITPQAQAQTPVVTNLVATFT